MIFIEELHGFVIPKRFSKCEVAAQRPEITCFSRKNGLFWSFCKENPCISVQNARISVAPQVGLEPTTLRLTAECSAIELLRHVVYSTDRGYYSKERASSQGHTGKLTRNVGRFFYKIVFTNRAVRAIMIYVVKAWGISSVG